MIMSNKHLNVDDVLEVLSAFFINRDEDERLVLMDEFESILNSIRKIVSEPSYQFERKPLGDIKLKLSVVLDNKKHLADLIKKINEYEQTPPFNALSVTIAFSLIGHVLTIEINA